MPCRCVAFAIAFACENEALIWALGQTVEHNVCSTVLYCYFGKERWWARVRVEVPVKYLPRGKKVFQCGTTHITVPVHAEVRGKHGGVPRGTRSEIGYGTHIFAPPPSQFLAGASSTAALEASSSSVGP